MSTMFEVPCPGCGQPMWVGAEGDAKCVPCDQRYHAGMGHLFPVADPPRDGLAATEHPAGVAP